MNTVKIENKRALRTVPNLSQKINLQSEGCGDAFICEIVFFAIKFCLIFSCVNFLLPTSAQGNLKRRVNPSRCP